MYALLTPSSQAVTSEEGFIDAYSGAAQAMTLTQLTANLQSVLQEGGRAQARFAYTAQTLLFGALSFTNTLGLQLGDGRWGVVWSPSCILPQLQEGYCLYARPDVPARGSILDRHGLGLAANGRRVVVGVVPEDLEQEESALRLLGSVLGALTEEIGFFFLTAAGNQDAQPGKIFPTHAEIDAFIDRHRDELGFLCSDVNSAGSAIIDGVYVEYRPDVGGFSHVVPHSDIIEQARIKSVIEKQAIIELEQHTAEWIPGACSVATVLREICEEHPQYVSAAVQGILRDNANQ